MALDAEYFDSIYIDVVKKKYYNAGKVQAVFEDIRRQAEALNAENESLRRQLASVNDRRVELGDALLSAQAVYQDVVERAKARAAEITDAAQRQAAATLEDAQRKSEAMLAESRRREDGAVRRVETAFNRMKELHMASIDALNAQWQDFLCGLDPEAEEPAPQAQEPDATTADGTEPAPEEALQAELEEKVGAIADQVFSLEEE